MSTLKKWSCLYVIKRAQLEEIVLCVITHVCYKYDLRTVFMETPCANGVSSFPRQKLGTTIVHANRTVKTVHKLHAWTLCTWDFWYTRQRWKWPRVISSRIIRIILVYTLHVANLALVSWSIFFSRIHIRTCTYYMYSVHNTHYTSINNNILCVL